MYRLKIKKKAFTLAETIIVCTIFAIMVVGIILGINRAFLFMNNTKVLVRATNFAREGVEMVYNIRDTNRRKYSGEKDKHRLDGGTGSVLLSGGIYVIKEGTTGTTDSYVYVDYLTGNSDFYDDMDIFFNGDNKVTREKSKISFPGTYSYYSGGMIATGKLEDLLGGTGIEFYRILRVFGVYCKNGTESNQVVDSSHCWNNTDPKELRFCVKVFYEFNGGRHASELCSIMTNFMK